MRSCRMNEVMQHNTIHNTYVRTYNTMATHNIKLMVAGGARAAGREAHKNYKIMLGQANGFIKILELATCFSERIQEAVTVCVPSPR